MMILMLWALFESSFFPNTFFSEERFNPALVQNQPMEIGFFAGRRYGLADLSEYRSYFKQSFYSVGMFSLGSDLYRENELSGSLSLSVYNQLYAGLSVHVLNCKISGISNRFNYWLRAGGVMHIGSLRLSGWINNINQVRFSLVDRLPITYSLRADYVLEENIVVGLAMRSIIGRLPFYNAGIKSRLLKILEIGIGLNTDPVMFEFAGSIHLGRLSIAYLGNSHQDLGLSHLLGVLFRL